MGLISSWERKGLHTGREDIIVRLLRRRFGSIAPEVIERIDLLSDDQLNELAEALLDFTSLADLETWLDQHATEVKS